MQSKREILCDTLVKHTSDPLQILNDLKIVQHALNSIQSQVRKEYKIAKLLLEKQNGVDVSELATKVKVVADGVVTNGAYKGRHIVSLWSDEATKPYVRYLAGYWDLIDSKGQLASHRRRVNPEIKRLASELLQGLCHHCFCTNSMTRNELICAGCYDKMSTTRECKK